MLDFSEIVKYFSPENGYLGVSFEKINFYDRMIVQKEQLLGVCRILKDKFKFDQLIDTVGIDRFTEQNRFEIVYNIWSNEYKTRIFLLVKLDSKKPEVDSLTTIWQTADWQEREAYDMLGIIFTNHPDLRRIYMNDSYEYYPLRKDYPLMGLPGAVELPNK